MPKVEGLPPIRGNRCCGNCGCYYEMPPNLAAQNLSLPVQGFCLKDPANFAKVRMMVPRINPKTNAPDKDRDGNVVMVAAEQPAYQFRPTLRELYCMDGWRPATALPGQRAAELAALEAATEIALTDFSDREPRPRDLLMIIRKAFMRIPQAPAETSPEKSN